MVKSTNIYKIISTSMKKNLREVKNDYHHANARKSRKSQHPVNISTPFVFIPRFLDNSLLDHFLMDF